jgi:hypothetical protein
MCSISMAAGAAAGAARATSAASVAAASAALRARHARQYVAMYRPFCAGRRPPLSRVRHGYASARRPRARSVEVYDEVL